MNGIAMVLAMVVMGVIFLISQVLILREFLLAFQRNEFVVGIVLGSWLLLEALGSGLTGRRADRSDNPLGAFATIQALLALLLLDFEWLGRSKTLNPVIGAYLVITYIGYIAYEIVEAAGS